MKHLFTLFFALWLFFGWVPAASGQVSAGDDKEICHGESVWLKADVSNSFATQLYLNDDTVVGPISIGFPFQFYGELYDSVYLSSNGWISFSPPYPEASSWNGGIAPKPIPNAFEKVPKNAIFGAWQDWSPVYSGGIGYETSGTAPNRIFTVSYCQVALYNCEDSTGTFQIVLREAAGNYYVDVNLNSKPYCKGWYDGKAVLGLQNYEGTDGVAAPNRNATQWDADKETWRFKPESGSYSVQLLTQYTPVLSGTLSPVAWYRDEMLPENYLGTADSIRVSPSVTATYIASVTLCGDLVFSDEVEVVVRPLPIANAGPDQTIIVGSAALLDGSASQYFTGDCTFSWTPPDKIADDPALIKPTTIDLSYTTAYYLALEDQYGCKSDSDRVVINVINGPLSLLVTAEPPSVCRGDTVLITAIGGGGQRPYQYAWTSDPPQAYPADSFLRVTPDHTVIYSCTLTDIDGQQEMVAITVQVMNPEPYISGQDVVCENEPNVLYFTPAHGNNSYFWMVEGGIINNNNIDTLVSVTWTNSGIGELIIKETLPPPLGCIAYDTLEVNILRRPSPTVIGPETVCQGDEGVEYYTPDVQDHTYTWTVIGGTTDPPGANPAQVAVSWGAPGQGLISVTEKLSVYPTCKTSRSCEITILPGPQPAIRGPQQVCEKESGVIYLSNMPEGTSNYWCINNGIITTPPDDDGIEVTWQQAGTGELILTQVVDSSGCAAETVPYLVTVNDKPEVLVSAPEITACEGDRVEVTAQGAVKYEWFPADGLAAPLEAEISFDAKESIIYQVIGTNDFDCKDTATVNVNVVLLPVVDLGEDTYILENESIELYAGEGYAYYEWQDGSTLPSFTACNPGIYFVYVENQGCFVYDTITISPTLGAIPIPTAFTPNADGLNDEFRLFGRLDKVEQFSMKIYSRNGQLLFETNDVFSGWKGENLQGQPVPAGTYIYRIDLFEQGNPFNQGIITRQGVVTLLR